MTFAFALPCLEKFGSCTRRVGAEERSALSEVLSPQDMMMAVVEPSRSLRPLSLAIGRLLLLTYFIAELYSKTVPHRFAPPHAPHHHTAPHHTALHETTPITPQVTPGFEHWSRVIADAGMPAPAAELVLVIALLTSGIVCVL